MKKIAILIATIAMMLGTNAFAQGKYGADSANCIKYLSYYKEYFKQKNYDEALPNWRAAFSICPPTANQTFLVDGTTLYRYLISKNAKNAEYRQALVDTLMTLHDTRVEYYPKNAVTALNNKGLDMNNYIKNDPKALYEGYNAIIENNGNQTKSTLLLLDLNAAIELYGNGSIQAEEVINVYQRNLDILEGITAKTDIEKTQNEKIKKDMESLFIQSQIADCDNLIAMFTPRYEASPDDAALIGNIVKIMSNTEGCQNNDLYLKAVTAMHKLEPSYNSAYFLYKLNSASGNLDEAIAFLEDAIAYPESDSKLDGEYYYELAAYCLKNGKTGKAFESARKAADLNDEFTGKSYFLIGTIWGSTSCGGNEVTRRAPYWVAVDYLIKAKNADPSLTEDANKLIGQYSRYYPQTAEAFMYDIIDGQSYTVSCSGMTATTTVRTQK